MKTKHFGHLLLVLLAIAGFSAITMLLWNALLPSIFGITSINFWQALGMLALIRILFGNIGINEMKRAHYRHHSHIREKWINMTPEERQKFINKRRQFGFGNPFGEDIFDDSKQEESEKRNG